MRRAVGSLALGTALIWTESARACATCFGAADAGATRGMNMAILGLLVITGGVLGALGTFFIYLWRRSRRHGDRLDGDLNPAVRDRVRREEWVS